MILLNEHEASALDAFIAEKWTEWRRMAADYLSEFEVNQLEAKLAGNCSATCVTCGCVKLHKEFYRTHKNGRGTCKVCSAKRNAAWRAANQDKRKSQRQQCKQRTKDRRARQEAEKAAAGIEVHHE